MPSLKIIQTKKDCQGWTGGFSTGLFSAVLSGIKEVEEVMAQAESYQRLCEPPMIFFAESPRLNVSRMEWTSPGP
jgi:hypothetical protein